MMKKRLLCLLMVLLLGTTSAVALAEDTDNLWAGAIDLTFAMDASAYPEADVETMRGVADLMNILHVTSTLTYNGSLLEPYVPFDTDISVGMNGKDGLLDFTLYGVPSNIGIKSPLLGDTELMLNTMAWLEFSMKTYFHLSMPLQTVALCTSTFANFDAFTSLRGVWEPVMSGSESRVIDRDTVMELAGSLTDTALTDRSFGYWVQALLMEAGYSEMVMESLETLPEHVDSFLGDDGITVDVTEAGESWTTGDLTLFTRTGDDWKLMLPASVEGYTVTAEKQGMTLVLQIGMEEEDDILRVSASAEGLPDGTAVSGAALLTFDVTGAMLAERHMRWEGSWTAEDNAAGKKDYAFTVTEKNTETQADMLTITGSVKELVPDHTPDYNGGTATGVNILSVYEDTLSELISAVKGPLLKGMLPILLEIPASTVQSVFGLLDQYGVLALLTDGISE